LRVCQTQGRERQTVVFLRVVVKIKLVQRNSKALLTWVIRFNRIDVLRDGRLLRGLFVAGASFEDYQFGVSELNKLRSVGFRIRCHL
jgi:hypothetical protein